MHKQLLHCRAIIYRTMYDFFGEVYNLTIFSKNNGQFHFRFKLIIDILPMQTTSVNGGISFYI